MRRACHFKENKGQYLLPIKKLGFQAKIRILENLYPPLNLTASQEYPDRVDGDVNEYVFIVYNEMCQATFTRFQRTNIFQMTNT